MERRVMVRPIRVEDVPLVAALLSESFYPTQGWWGWATPIVKLGIYQDLKMRCFAKSSNYACLVGIEVAENGRQRRAIVGTVEVSARPLLAWPPVSASVPYVANLAVAPAFRRQGLGRQLLLACEPIVKTWGFGDLYLHVRGENQAARKLYASLGYRLYCTEMPNWIKLLGQSQELLLRKSLQLSRSRPGPGVS